MREGGRLPLQVEGKWGGAVDSGALVKFEPTRRRGGGAELAPRPRRGACLSAAKGSAPSPLLSRSIIIMLWGSAGLLTKKNPNGAGGAADPALPSAPQISGLGAAVFLLPQLLAVWGGGGGRRRPGQAGSWQAPLNAVAKRRRRRGLQWQQVGGGSGVKRGSQPAKGSPPPCL